MKEPKLFVDINISKDIGVKRIIVYEDDTPENLAKEFCYQHNLKTEVLKKLTVLLEQQISS